MRALKRKLRTRQDNVGDAEQYNIWLFPILNGEAPKGHATLLCCRRVCQLLSELQQLETIRRILKPLARDWREGGGVYGMGFVHRFRDPQAEDLYRTCLLYTSSAIFRFLRHRPEPDLMVFQHCLEIPAVYSAMLNYRVQALVALEVDQQNLPECRQIGIHHIVSGLEK